MDVAYINDIMRNYRFVHIVYNDKFAVEVVDFFNRNFDVRKHLFLVQRKFEQFPMPTGENVIEFKEMYGLDFTHPNIKKVIMHSLFIKTCFRYWYANPDVQAQKGYWLIYGGDLYDAPRNEMADTVRRGFRGYISDTDGDCNVVKGKYDLINKEYYSASYCFPITLDMVNCGISQRKEKDYIQIQVNNSCDYSTIPMLKTLSRYKGEKIKVVTILSYGNMEYKDEIIETGQDIFGDKFIAVEEFLPYAEYAKHLAQNDIYVLNQNRQQGLGNSIASLVCGVKLFIKSEITTYNHFNSKDIFVYDTNIISDMAYDEFIRYPAEIKTKTMEKAKMFYDDAYLKRCWEPVFNN